MAVPGGAGGGLAGPGAPEEGWSLHGASPAGIMRYVASACCVHAALVVRPSLRAPQPLVHQPAAGSVAQVAHVPLEQQYNRTCHPARGTESPNLRWQQCQTDAALQKLPMAGARIQACHLAGAIQLESTPRQIIDCSPAPCAQLEASICRQAAVPHTCAPCKSRCSPPFPAMCQGFCRRCSCNSNPDLR